jgi:hypothetical protein
MLFSQDDNPTWFSDAPKAAYRGARFGIANRSASRACQVFRTTMLKKGLSDVECESGDARRVVLWSYCPLGQ